jgi:hypothetical protein
MPKIRMKISERFALNENLREYPNDKTFAEVLELVEKDHHDVIAWQHITAGPNELAQLIESTRDAFESATDDLMHGVALHDVREGDLDRPETYIVTSRRVATYKVQAIDEDDALDKHSNGESELIDEQTMEITAEQATN